MADGKSRPKTIYTFQQNTRVSGTCWNLDGEDQLYIFASIFSKKKKKKKIYFGGLSHIDREQVEYNNNMYTTLLSASWLCMYITLTTHTDGRSPV